MCRDGSDRLDRWLAGWPSIGSRKKASVLVRSGRVEVDGRPIPADAGSTPVPAGARVVVHWNRPGTSKAAVVARQSLGEAGVSVLFEDDRVLVVDKPVGLLTDTATRKQARERDSVRARATTYLSARGQRPVVVHRIDRDTSGVVVLAKDAAAGEALRGAFARHEPERVYLAWVHGQPRDDEGTWEDWMAWDGRANIQRPCDPDARGAALARSWWRVSERFEPHGVTRIELRLDTGRRNQIRLQAALRGAPLVGETQYLPDRWTRRPPALPRQALHAWRVGFAHPGHGGTVQVTAPLPADLTRLEARLRP